MNGAGGTHLSAAELAELELPGLPSTKRRINERAGRENWAYIDRIGRGGGRLYAVSSLPAEARRALADRRGRRIPANTRPVGRPRGSDYFTRNPEVAGAVEAILAERQLAAPRILELLAQSFHDLPSRRSLSRFIAKLEREKKALLASTRNPDEYKSRYRVALGRADAGVTHAHQVWELDTTKADVLTKGGRIMVLGLIDRWSRRARFLVVPSESGQSVRRLLVETIRAWGVMPEMVATDNGSGFINASIVSALETLGIRHWRCPPGSPEKKPYVERLFGTFTRERAELLDGFAGHNVAEAQQLRSKAKKATGRALVVPEMTPAELQDVLTAWVEGVYHQREHKNLRMSPMRKWMSSPVPARAAPSEDVLKIALSRLEGVFIVGKKGVRWKNGVYWSPRLPEYMGRPVQVRRDEDDLGALFLFDEDGHFIDTAVNAERAGMSEEAFARAARRHQDEYMKSARAELRARQRDFSFEAARDALLRHDAERAGKLVAIPPRTVERSTPAIDSIANAPAPALPSAAALEDAMRRTAPRQGKPELTPAQKVAWADRVIGQARAGGEADPAELKRAELYATSTEYRAEKLLTGDFAAPRLTRPTERRQRA